jgi:hypothetical protein
VIEGKRIWTCDKCGTVTETGDGAFPTGWGVLTARFFDDQYDQSVPRFDACRSCMEGFVANWKTP